MADLPKAGKEVKRKRVLSDNELRLAWGAAEQVGWPMGPALQLLMLTLARRDEIGDLQWSEIDKARNEIRLEGERARDWEARTKTGEAHIIPLSPAARALIDGLPCLRGCKFVFSTTARRRFQGGRAQSGKPISLCWRAHRRKRASGAMTPMTRRD
jgi:integrase